MKKDSFSYILIEVVERNIETFCFDTLEAAQDFMKKRWEQARVDGGVDDNDDESGIGKTNAWCNGCDNNYDWRIVTLSRIDGVLMSA